MGVPGRNLGDLELLTRALAGDPRAIDAFLERMRCIPRFLHVKNARLGTPLQPDELADLVQDTLVAVWEKLDHYDGRAALETWVFGFCHLELLRRLRTLRRAPQASDLDQVDLHPAPSEAQSEALEIEHVLDCLEQLPTELAQVLRLKHLEQLTFEQAAARLELSPNTVKTRYYRGLERLRRMIERRFLDPSQRGAAS